MHTPLHTVDLSEVQMEFLAGLVLAETARLNRVLRLRDVNDLPWEALVDIHERVRIGVVLMARLHTCGRFARGPLPDAKQEQRR